MEPPDPNMTEIPSDVMAWLITRRDMTVVPSRIFVWFLAHALNSLPHDEWLGGEEGTPGPLSALGAMSDVYCCPYCCGPCAGLQALSDSPWVDQKELGAAIVDVYGPGTTHDWQNPDGTINWVWVRSRWMLPNGTYPMQKYFNCHTIREDGTHASNSDDDDGTD